MNSWPRLFIMVFFLGLACLGLSGCSTPLIYRMDIQQGNAINEEMVRSLRVGLTKDQVIERLGTPALQHTFDNNRWDYYYYFKSGRTGKETEKRFTIYFKNNRVTRWE